MIAQLLFNTHQDQSVSWDMDVLETLALLLFASSEDLGLAYQALDAFHAIQEFQAYLEWGAWMDWVYAETYGKVLVMCAAKTNN